jgi:3-hydroxyisobutyrate dehydrogenase-like beta-hydroxyacid dehydrogenase
VVGAPIVRQLDQAGWNVRVTSRHASQARAKLGPRQYEAKKENSEDIHQSSAGNFMACRLPCRKLRVL